MSYEFGPSGKTWIADPVPAVPAPPVAPPRILKVVAQLAPDPVVAVAPPVALPPDTGHTMAALQLVKHGLRPHVLAIDSKRPMATEWQKETVFDAASVRNRFEAAPPGVGVGILTGAGLLVIDVDQGGTKVGGASLATLQGSLGLLPDTVTCRTRSGGRHLYFRLPDGVVLKNSASKLATDIDTRCVGGQVVAPPSVVDGQPYTWIEGKSPDAIGIADLPPKWLAALVALEVPALALVEQTATLAVEGMVVLHDDAFESERRTKYMASLTEPSVQGENGNAAMMRATFHAKEFSRTPEQALTAMQEWNTRLAQPAWADDELTRAIRRSEAVFGAALDRVESTPATDAPTPEPAPSATLAPPDCIAYVRSMKAYVARAEDGESWDVANPLDQADARRELISNGIDPATATRLVQDHGVIRARGIDCEPTKGDTFQRDGHLYINTYVPSTITPEAGAFPVLDHVLTHLTAGNVEAKVLVNWLAFAYRRQGRMSRTAPVLYGAQKGGKSLLARAVSTLIGESNCANISDEDLSSKFNSQYVTSLFVTIGEISASEKVHAQTKLKFITGEPDLMMEAKYSARVKVKNRIKLLATSNQTLPVYVEGDADTRWVLFKQTEPPTDAYDAAMKSLFDDENRWSPAGLAELRAFAHHLNAHLLDDTLAGQVYKGEGRAESVAASMNNVHRFADMVDASNLDDVFDEHVKKHERDDVVYKNKDIAGGFISVTALYATYCAVILSQRLQPLGCPNFTVELARARPRWRILGQVDGVDRRPKGVKVTVYVGVPRRPETARVDPFAPEVEVVSGPTDHPGVQAILTGFNAKQVLS